MARGLSYADAARILGGNQNRYVAALDKVMGGLLLGAAVVPGGAFALSLFDPAGTLAKLSGDLLAAVRERLDGVRRFDRTQRLEAAHAVLVLAAFFEELSAADLPFDLSRADQTYLSAGVTGKKLADLGLVLLRREVPCPAPYLPGLRVEGFYQALSVDVAHFVQGLAVWDRLDETAQRRLGQTLADCAVRAQGRYEGMFRQLAAEFPEVAFWAGSVDHQATRARLRALSESLAGLGLALDDLAIGRAPDERRHELNRVYRAALDRPILRADEAPGGALIPTLGELYINPRFRVTHGASAQELASEPWWSEVAVRDDLQDFLTGFFTGPAATEAPLLVLGQPGSGKSALSKVLAGRLPASDFLTVIVPLREVPADADVQTQAEHAIRDATGETVAWPDLVRGAGDAMPVVILDGFDELVQAIGTTQSDYLEKVAAFQRREAELGRPVAVVVTSRTAVADRARSVGGMVAVRLEPFDEEQIRRWLQLWNAANDGPSADAVLGHFSLATQPLLLLMLALYQAEGHALDGFLGQYELYESLLTAFAVREVRKDGAALSEQEFRLAVEQELIRLSVVAFAMFNRNRQWATEAELDADLPALLGAAPPVRPVGMRAPLTAAQVAVGRFYFVHQAQAVRDGVPQRTYEFLHATFGEFLVARLVIKELEAFAASAELNSGRGRSTPPDDDFLFALLSHSALPNRNTVINFLGEGLDDLPEERRSALRGRVLELFQRALFARRASAYDEYQAGSSTVTCRHAAWSANLVVVAVLAGQEVTAKQLFPERKAGIHSWRSIALLWRSQLNAEGWNGMVHTLELTRAWDGEGRVLLIRRAPERLANIPPMDLNWSYPGVPRYDLADVRQHSTFLCDPVDDALMHAVEQGGWPRSHIPEV